MSAKTSTATSRDEGRREAGAGADTATLAVGLERLARTAPAG